ncbi:MAG: DUF192 domain-containing protein [Pseudomonadota bacterium]
MKSTIIWIVILAVIALGLFAWDSQRQWQPQTQAQVTLRQVDLRIETQAGQKHMIRTEIADTAQSVSTGMMYRTSMPAGTGMLFVLPQPSDVQFWMKNTLVPLDMVFIDENRVIQKIHANAIPHDETLIPAGGLVSYVLEIPSGSAAEMGISVGDKIFY